MKRANIGCLDNRDRISDGKTFIQKEEEEEGELSISSSSSPVTWTVLRGSHWSRPQNFPISGCELYYRNLRRQIVQYVYVTLQPQIGRKSQTILKDGPLVSRSVEAVN